MSRYAAIVAENTKIDPALYEKYNVKRGLRNADGTGVLVGLSTVGSVIGYVVEEQDKVPIEGKLIYRGIDVPEIIAGCQREKRLGFEETAFLLLFGKLPARSELQDFNTMLDGVRALPHGFKEDAILRSPSPDIMNKLARCILSSYAYDPTPDDIGCENVLRQCLALIARFPTFIAYGYQAKAHYFRNESLFLHNPVEGKSTAETFLMLMRPDSAYTALEAEILDLCLILHAEHGGGNNSTFTNHVVTSTHTDTYSAMAASVLALKGPLHGGANLQVERMMADIQANVKDWTNEGAVADYLNKILAKQAFDKKGLIYGLGHAVYTLSDPRTAILREKARELAANSDKAEIFALYQTVERLGPELFRASRNLKNGLCVNVDFYSGLVYTMLGIPAELYTPLFAMARIAGWSAHRLEELLCGGKIIRPAYKSIAPRRNFIPIDIR
ncbi:MAG: citrate/2-methylcitrate synthase [Kiritimatiellaeota bacterium]|nr:citrate/2-methylcitrate synthase [Kiritimatiellota bacterium]